MAKCGFRKGLICTVFFKKCFFFFSLFIISVPVYTQHNLSVYTFVVSQSTLPNQKSGPAPPTRAIPRLEKQKMLEVDTAPKSHHPHARHATRNCICMQPAL